MNCSKVEQTRLREMSKFEFLPRSMSNEPAEATTRRVTEICFLLNNQIYSPFIYFFTNVYPVKVYIVPSTHNKNFWNLDSKMINKRIIIILFLQLQPVQNKYFFIVQKVNIFYSPKPLVGLSLITLSIFKFQYLQIYINLYTKNYYTNNKCIRKMSLIVTRESK